MKRIAVLGSTGSIGRSTLDVVRRLPDRCRIVGLGARSDWVLGLSGDDPRRLDQTKFFGGFRVRF